MVKTFMVSAWVVLADQLSKVLVQNNLPHGQSTSLAGGFLRLTLTYNPGGAFGLDLGGNNLFLAFSLLISALVVYYLWMLPKGWHLRRFALALILGGAIGNVVDRIRLGEVIDFINIGYQRWRWPVFNVADLAVTIGVVLFLWIYIFHREKRDGQKVEKGGPATG